MDYKEFEGATPGPWELWTRDFYTMQLKAKEKNIAIIQSDVDRLLIASAPDLLKENQSLKLELQKQKELNAELVKCLNEIAGRSRGIIRQIAKRSLESLIKKSSEI